MIIYLRSLLPGCCSNRPAGSRRTPTCCLILLLTRLTLPLLLPAVRWALTPPFHPCRLLGGIFSVVLSIASPLPGVTRRHILWSPDFPQAALRPPAIISPTL